MPNFNKRGPNDEGAMTGRKMGRCTNFGAGRRKQSMQENENSENLVSDTQINDNVQEQGIGRGRGMGRGMRNGMGNGPGNGMSKNRGGRGMGQNGAGRGMGQSGTGRGMGMGRRLRNEIQE